MWQPKRSQGWVLWVLAALVVLLWPMGGGRSLALKSVRFLADPSHSLPVMPPPLPMGLGDDGFAVTRHDEQVRDYRRAYRSSWVTRTRIRARDLEMPLSAATQRQVLAAIAVLAGFLIWYLHGKEQKEKGPGRTDAGTEA